jgi:hypothetical protein
LAIEAHGGLERLKQFTTVSLHGINGGVLWGAKPLNAIPYKEVDLNLPWHSFNIAHELTNKGIQKFVADYQSTLRRSA